MSSEIQAGSGYNITYETIEKSLAATAIMHIRGREYIVKFHYDLALKSAIPFQQFLFEKRSAITAMIEAFGEAFDDRAKMTLSPDGEVNFENKERRRCYHRSFSPFFPARKLELFLLPKIDFRFIESKDIPLIKVGKKRYLFDDRISRNFEVAGMSGQKLLSAFAILIIIAAKKNAINSNRFRKILSNSCSWINSQQKFADENQKRAMERGLEILSKFHDCLKDETLQDLNKLYPQSYDSYAVSFALRQLLIMVIKKRGKHLFSTLPKIEEIYSTEKLIDIVERYSKEPPMWLISILEELFRFSCEKLEVENQSQRPRYKKIKSVSGINLPLFNEITLYRNDDRVFITLNDTFT